MNARINAMSAFCATIILSCSALHSCGQGLPSLAEPHPATTQGKPAEPHAPSASGEADSEAEWNYEEHLAPHVKTAFNRLIERGQLESSRSTLARRLYCSEPSDQIPFLESAENLLTSRPYRLISVEARFESILALRYVPANQRARVSRALCEVLPLHPQSTHVDLIQSAALATGAHLADALYLHARMAKSLPTLEDQEVFVRTLARGPVPESARFITVALLQWLCDDDRDNPPVADMPLAESLAHLVVGCAEDVELQDYLITLLAHPTPQLRAMGRGLASFVRSRRPHLTGASGYLEILLRAPDQEFIGAMQDMAHLFATPNEPEILASILRLEAQDQQWRGMLFALRRYQGDTQTLHRLAEVPAGQQSDTLTRAIRNMLDRNRDGRLTAELIEAAAQRES